MVIEFTKKQFKALLKAVYLGNWLANAHRVEGMKKEYEEIEDLVFSKAAEFGFEGYADREDDGRCYPSNKFEKETDVHLLHEEYDEESLWEELANKLGERDFAYRFSKEEIEQMSSEERFLYLQACIVPYEVEFEKYGLGRVVVMKTLANKSLN